VTKTKHMPKEERGEKPGAYDPDDRKPPKKKTPKR
jgi:hypothetical protein